MQQPVTFYSNTNKWTTNTATWYNNNNTCSVKVPAAPATISNWTALWWRDDTTAWDKEYAAAANTNITSCASSMYAVYGRSYAAHFYSAANKATDRTKQSSTGYYNSNISSLPTTVSITLETAANSTDITNWTELWWRDDTTAWGKEYDYGSTQTVAWWTNFYSVYSRTLTITYDWNWNTAGSTSNTTKPVYMNANSTTTSDQAVILATNGFTKTWYTFRKWKIWNTEYAEWWSYNPSLAYNAWTFGATAIAQWQANVYNISYTMDGWTNCSPAPTSATYDVTFTWCNNPTKEGYTFLWWKITWMDSVTHTYGNQTTTDTSIASTTATTFKNLTSVSGNTVTFTALWTWNTYKVEYYLDNTKKWESTHTYGVSSALRTASNLWLSKAWYTFYGWSTANGNLTRTYTDGQSI